MATDWYERRDELREGMVFKSCWGIVRLDHRKPGDGTDWIVAEWSHSSIGPSGGWACYESSIHPGDLADRLPDDYAGEVGDEIHAMHMAEFGGLGS